jgi:ribose transport system permease protein
MQEERLMAIRNEPTAQPETVRAGGLGPRLTETALRILRVREAFLVVILLAIVVVMSIVSPGFRTEGNFRAVMLGFSMEGMVVIGMTMLLVAGLFDLSVGSTMALCGMLTADLLLRGVPEVVAILTGLVAGMAVGLVNGLIVSKVKVNALIATLGTMSIVRGIALTIWQGQPVINLPSSFTALGKTVVWGMPLPFIMLVFLVIITDILMRRGRWFRQAYYVGGSEKASLLSGIKVDQVRIVLFIVMGLTAALGGIISTARLGAGYPNSYESVALRVISGAVIGGCSLFGGEGTIIGAVLGLLFVSVLSDIMVLFGISPYLEGVVQGTALILAVVADLLTRRRARRA